MLGGAFGNLTDRLFREPGFGVGHVIDFIQIWGFPAIFNIADIAVVTGMGLFLLLTLRGVGLDGTRHVEGRADGSTADDAVRAAVPASSGAACPVPDGLAGERADAALAKLLGFSRTFAAEVVEAGGVTLDGVALGKSDRLTAGGWLEVEWTPKTEPDDRAGRSCPASRSSTTTTTSS